MDKQIIRLAIPNIISNLSIPLMGSVDTALMGWQDSDVYLGGIALGALVFNFIYWSFGFLRMGTTGITAQAYGEKADATIIHTFARALLMVVLLASLLLVFQYPLKLLSFNLLNGTPEVESLAGIYFNIRIWAAPATLGLYVLMGSFLGMQNAFYPMFLTILINIVNIVLNLLFVEYYGMTVDGVAYATVIAQYLGFIVGLFFFFRKYAYLLKSFQQKAVLEFTAFNEFISINKDIFIRTFCLVLTFAFFTNSSAGEGNVILAVNGVLLQFTFWMSYGVDGFAFAAESLVGKYAGAKDRKKLVLVIKRCFFWGMMIGLAYSLFYLIAGQTILRIFTDQQHLIDAASPYLIWLVIFPIIGAPSYIWDGIYVGLTASKAMRDSMFISMLIFFLAYFLFAKMWGNHGLWFALSIYVFARGIIQTVWYLKGSRDLKV